MIEKEHNNGKLKIIHVTNFMPREKQQDLQADRCVDEKMWAHRKTEKTVRWQYIS